MGSKLKIALVWPKSTFLDNPIMWPPLGLLYLSSRLNNMGHSTEFYDMNFSELPSDGEYDQLWLSATTPQRKDVRRISEITKNWTKTKIVFGGANAWDDPTSCEEFGFDLVVGGESDHPDNIIKIFNALENKEKYLFLPVSRSLDWVLPPNRKWTKNYHSYMYDLDGNKYRMSSLFTSRGCPMSCAFCSSGRLGIIWDKLVRYESIDIVEEQIKEISDMGFDGLAYYDDILPLNKKRTLQILELHQKYKMKFRCFLRTDIICNHGGKDYLKAMKDGGLIQVFIGVESADNRIKENIQKGTTIEQDNQVIEWCHELGIMPKCSLILGLPGEDMESMNKTRDWILSHDPSKIRVQPDRLIRFPGTPLSNSPAHYDLKWEMPVDEDWFYRGSDDIESHSFASTSKLSIDEIDDFLNKLNKEIKALGYRA